MEYKKYWKGQWKEDKDETGKEDKHGGGKDEWR